MGDFLVRGGSVHIPDAGRDRREAGEEEEEEMIFGIGGITASLCRLSRHAARAPPVRWESCSTTAATASATSLSSSPARAQSAWGTRRGWSSFRSVGQLEPDENRGSI